MTRQNNPLANLVQPVWKPVKVNGFEIRNHYPDWDVVETKWSIYNPTLVLELKKLDMLPCTSKAAHAPHCEAWVDQRFWREHEQLLETHWQESALKRLGWARHRIRNFINRNLPKTAPRSKFVVQTETWHGLKICYVAGEIIRDRIDREFVFGGHDKVYKYIPPNEVWIDICQNPNEVKYVLHHELFERNLMADGMSYNRAHALATKAELQMRRLHCNPPRYYL